jgi:hypothetical protein
MYQDWISDGNFNGYWHCTKCNKDIPHKFMYVSGKVIQNTEGKMFKKTTLTKGEF